MGRIGWKGVNMVVGDKRDSPQVYNPQIWQKLFEFEEIQRLVDLFLLIFNLLIGA